MFKPADEQRWDPVEGFRPSLASTAAQKELRHWTIMALGALALAGVFALLLAISRIPGADTLFPWPVAFYKKSLIIHVVFSFVVWFVAGGVLFMTVGSYRMREGTPGLPNMTRTATAAMAIAFILLAVPALLDRGEPSLNNYVPAITDPIYYVGLLAVALAGLLGGTRVLLSALQRTGPLEPMGAVGCSCAKIFAFAIIAFAISWDRIGGMPEVAADNEDLFWAGGHILQFFNISLLIGAWVLLGGRALGTPAAPPRLVMGALLLNTLLAGIALALLFIEAPLSAEEKHLFTLYQYALAPAPIIIGLIIAKNVLSLPSPDSAPARAAKLALVLSLVVFFTGGILGIFVDGTDTRTPAHYHGVIGGVNLAMMAFIILFVLPLLERGLVRWRGIRLAFWGYGLGQLLHSVGLFVAGGYGAPRKVADTAPGMDVIGNWIGHVGIGIGGVIAVIGGVLFIWIGLSRVLKHG